MSRRNTIFGVDEPAFDKILHELKMICEQSRTPYEEEDAIMLAFWGRPAKEVFVAGTLYGMTKTGINTTIVLVNPPDTADCENDQPPADVRRKQPPAGRTVGFIIQPLEKRPSGTPDEAGDIDARRLSKIITAS